MRAMTTADFAAAPQPLTVDPDEFRPDPHAGYAKYRPLSPVLSFGGPIAVITRYADADALLTDPRTRQIETEGLALLGITSGTLHNFYAHSMLTSNQPAHKKRRAPASRAFGFRLVQAWRPRIRAMVHGLIDRHEAEGQMNFLETVAAPLPAHLTAEILGAPEADAPRFAKMVYGMSRGIGSFKPEMLNGIEAAAGELHDYVAALLADRRAAPRDDFLSDYLREVDAAGQLNETEILVQIVTLIIGGSDTTRAGLTALVSLLLQHPEQWQAVRDDPSLAEAAVLEALRYEPPAGSIGRLALEEIDVGGIPLPPGTPMNVSFVSAQRDDAVYANAQMFDIHRTDHPKWSLSFGGGTHRCLGEALARAEMEEALIALTERLPNLSLKGDPPRLKGHTGIRGITPMQVSWA